MSLLESVEMAERSAGGYSCRLPKVLTEHDFLLALGQTRFSDGTIPASMKEFLALSNDPNMMDDMAEEVFSSIGTRLTIPSVGLLFTRRHRELCGMPREICLPVYVGIEVFSVTIPDSSRDEMLLDIEITSGADAEELMCFAVQQNLYSRYQASELKSRWLCSDAALGSTEIEQTMLDKCLGLRLDSTVSIAEISLSFNYGEQTHKIWRISRVMATLSTVLDLSNYPFDRSLVCVTLRSSGGFDASEIVFLRDLDATPTADLAAARHPRGCRLTTVTPELELTVESPSKDSLSEATVRFAFDLIRVPDMLVWRTYIPALVILLMGFSATAAVLLFGISQDSVMTQVLPSVLIACVALQLTAAQHIPAHSGRTTLDSTFVLVYFQVIALYIAMLMASIDRPAVRTIAMSLVAGASLCFLGLTIRIISLLIRVRK